MRRTSAFATCASAARISIPGDQAVANYDRAVVAGITSIMSKMGISTMQGYHSAQIFEILGLDDSLVEKYFMHTSTRIGGLDAAGVPARAQRALRQRPGSGEEPLARAATHARASPRGVRLAARST